MYKVVFILFSFICSVCVTSAFAKDNYPDNAREIKRNFFREPCNNQKKLAGADGDLLVRGR